jgi:hypothetical protein
MHSNLLYFTAIVIMKVMSQSSHLPWELIKVILGGGIFVLAHFKALHSIANHFPSYMFPSIIDDTHIIGPLSIVSSTHEHFQTKLHAIGFSIQPHKCVAWSPSSLPLDFNTPSQFTTPSKGIRILGVPLGTLIFTPSFIKNTLQ